MEEATQSHFGRAEQKGTVKEFDHSGNPPEEELVNSGSILWLSTISKRYSSDVLIEEEEMGNPEQSLGFSLQDRGGKEDEGRIIYGDFQQLRNPIILGRAP